MWRAGLWHFYWFFSSHLGFRAIRNVLVKAIDPFLVFWTHKFIINGVGGPVWVYEGGFERKAKTPVRFLATHDGGNVLPGHHGSVACVDRLQAPGACGRSLRQSLCLADRPLIPPVQKIAQEGKLLCREAKEP